MLQAQTDTANTKANVTEKALKQEQQERAGLEARLSNLQHRLQVNAEETAAANAAAAEAAAKLPASFHIAADTPFFGSLFSLGAMLTSSAEQIPQLLTLQKGPSHRQD